MEGVARRTSRLLRLAHPQSLSHGQQADRATLVRVLTEPMELRDVAVKEPQMESPEGAELRVVR